MSLPQKHDPRPTGISLFPSMSLLGIPLLPHLPTHPHSYAA